MSTDLRHWLQQQGLAHLHGVLGEAGVDLDVLGDLAEADLAGLGISLGDRKRLLKAVAASAPPLPAHPDAQRRQVTVMFCDLVGSTSLSTQMDPEDFGDLISHYHGVVSRCVEDSGGFVAQLLGDGVLAYFGYPIASEDDAERAVRCALALARGLGSSFPNDAGSARVAVRVGVATGTVVVGERSAQGWAAERAAVGDTPNLAARLQALAEPGQVLIAASTRRLLGDLFELVDRGARPLKGFGQPVPLWEVAGEREGASRFQAQRAGLSGPMVGREVEMTTLGCLWECAERGEGQVVLVCGEPGIGKSCISAALCRQILSAAPETLPWVLTWQCSPLHGGTPLHPVVQQLRQALKPGRGDRAEELEQRLLLDGVGLDTRVRLLRLAGLAHEEGGTVGDASVEKLNTLHALVEVLAAKARLRPLLLLLEDAHWIDPSTAELLALAMQQLGAQRVMVLVTARPGYELEADGAMPLTRITLGRISSQQCAELAQQVALEVTHAMPGCATLDPLLLQQIVQRTDGVPLFVEELVKSVLEAGPQQGRGESDASSIPSTLQDSLMARLDRLRPATREVAQTAAVMGREFDEQLLHQVMRPTPARHVEEALEELQRAGLIQRATVQDRALASFKHALVRDAAYGSQLKAPRAARHAQVARAMEIVFPLVAASQPELLAAHHQHAGEHDLALQRWREAGDLAFSRSSLAEAANHFRAAIALCGVVGPVGAVEFHLQMQLSAVLTQTQGYASQEGLQAAQRALALCAAPELRVYRVEAVRAAATILVSRGRIDETEQLLADAGTRQLADASPHAEASWLWVRGAADFVAGRFGAADRHLRGALERMDAVGEGQLATQWHGANPRVSTLSWLERALMFLGRLDEGFACAQESLVLARRAQHPPTLTWVLLDLVSWHHLAGQSREAAALAREALELAQRHQIRSRIGVARVIQGRGLVLGGRVAEGAELMRSGVDLWLETCSVLTATLLVTGPAWAMASVGDVRAVEEYLRIGERLLHETQERAGEAELMRIRAWLQRTAGDRVAARATLLDALSVARRQESLLLALRAALDLVELSGGGEYEDEARAELRRVYGAFTQGFGFTALRAARRVLETPPAR